MALAGEHAINCGRVTRGQKPIVASDCARKALASSQAFYVSYDQMGPGGGDTDGFAGNGKGNLYWVEYSTESLLSSPLPVGAHLSGKNHIMFGNCPMPAKLFHRGGGELTCSVPME